ncbi:MAG: hypothetical protein WDO71_21625 [Bacteroidota bacterium]
MIRADSIIIIIHGGTPITIVAKLHSLQSVTKTITSVIIGVATARKEFPDLSTTILSFF